MPTIKKIAATLAAATALCVAPTATADPGVLTPTGYAYGWSESFTTNMGSFNAGGFMGTWNGQGIEFWCIELTQYFGFGGPYNYVAVPENIPVLTALGQLFTLAHASALSDADHSAAFQLAIWEIVYEGGGSLSLASGNFAVSAGDTDALSIAQGWLSSLGPNSPDTWNLTMLTSASSQDFVTFGKTFARTVPEPTPLALLATALLAMIVVRRREHRIGA